MILALRKRYTPHAAKLLYIGISLKAQQPPKRAIATEPHSASLQRECRRFNAAEDASALSRRGERLSTSTLGSGKRMTFTHDGERWLNRWLEANVARRVIRGRGAVAMRDVPGERGTRLGTRRPCAFWLSAGEGEPGAVPMAIVVMPRRWAIDQGQRIRRLTKRGGAKSSQFSSEIRQAGPVLFRCRS